MRWLFVVPLALCSLPLFVTDVREHRLPNRWNAALASGGLLVNATVAWSRNSVEPLVAAVSVGFAGLLGMFALHWVTRGGLGLGDVKLVGALGCGIADPLMLFIVVFAAFMLAGMWVIVGRYQRGSRVAFGPFLLIGAWLGVALS